MQLTFCKAFENAFVIYDQQERVGFIAMLNDNTIRDIDIVSSDFKSGLLFSFLENIGRDEIFAVVDKSFAEYFEDFGFDILSGQQDGKMKLKYSICETKNI